MTERVTPYERKFIQSLITKLEAHPLLSLTQKWDLITVALAEADLGEKGGLIYEVQDHSGRIVDLLSRNNYCDLLFIDLNQLKSVVLEMSPSAGNSVLALLNQTMTHVENAQKRAEISQLPPWFIEASR